MLGWDRDPGSIPAGAGEPSMTTRTRRATWVYPRGCGGAEAEAADPERDEGLSPRVRGSRRAATAPCGFPGSIPAGAGEPQRHHRRHGREGVYPRGCGGADLRSEITTWGLGLSPRVRGSHLALDGVEALLGSIPAGAGEPSSGMTRLRRSRVYPRGCGGARTWPIRARSSGGLSPRVRGSRVRGHAAPGAVGSIPAGAGEPRRA